MVILNSQTTSLALWARKTELTNTGPVVRRPISANPWLNFNAGFFSFCSKAFSRIIFSILFRASNHQIVGKKNNFKLNLLFKLSYLNSNFPLTPSYLNPALNNPALIANFSSPGLLDTTFFACWYALGNSQYVLSAFQSFIALVCKQYLRRQSCYSSPFESQILVNLLLGVQKQLCGTKQEFL